MVLWQTCGTWRIWLQVTAGNKEKELLSDYSHKIMLLCREQLLLRKMVMNARSPSDYDQWFFCSQASSQVIKGAITHMDFSWFRDLGPNFRDPLTLSATLCTSSGDDKPGAYTLTFGRDLTFVPPAAPKA
jgi:hypothetical protein